jgi:hypothetical protein
MRRGMFMFFEAIYMPGSDIANIITYIIRFLGATNALEGSNV